MEKTITEEYIIPQNLIDKDLWVVPPDYERKDGAKFVMNEDLNLKDRKYLVSVGQPLILRGGAKVAADKAKKVDKEEKKATTDVESVKE